MNLEQQLRSTISRQGKEDSTADSYWRWVYTFLAFVKAQRGQWVHPAELGRDEVEQWLTHLANVENVAANTQNQAFSALCYLYREVLKQPLENVNALRAKRPILTREIVDQSEVLQLFAALRGIPLLCAMMMYGCGFRIGDLGRLRIKDISFSRRQIAVRGAKGKKDRMVGFPVELHAGVQRQINSMRVQWQHDMAAGLNGVSLPYAFGRKSPKAHLDFAWWYLFASDKYSRDPKSGRLLRHHRDMGHISRCITQAVRRAGIPKRITSHCLRHSFATHSLEAGVRLHVLQQLMGHNDLETTAGYLHVTKDGATSARSPLTDLLARRVEPVAEKNEKPALNVFAG